MDAATNVLLTTLKRSASVCAVFRIKRAAVHRAKDSDSKEGVMETPICRNSKRARAWNASQDNPMPRSPITLHKVIDGVELIVC